MGLARSDIQSASPSFQDLGNDDEVKILDFCPETVPVEGSSGLDLADFVSQKSQDIASKISGICSPASITIESLPKASDRQSSE